MKSTFSRFPSGKRLIFTPLLFIATNCFCQDGVNGFAAFAGYQSAALSWNSFSFPIFSKQAGFLIIYSTSTPSLVSSAKGKSPDYAVENGTIVWTVSATYPLLPATTALATGLSNGTTYNFMIVPYVWDGTDASTYEYSQPSFICATIPPDGPANLALRANSKTAVSIGGTFTLPLFGADGYIVAYGKNSTPPKFEDGRSYSQGDAIGDDTVVQVSADPAFNTLQSGNQLASSTAYYIYAFSYSSSGCNAKPVYSSAFASDSITTSTVGAPKNDTASIFLALNPVHAIAKLNISSPNSGLLDLSMISIDGKELQRRVVCLSAGNCSIDLNTSGYAKGMYIVIGSFHNGKRTVLPVVIQ